MLSRRRTIFFWYTCVQRRYEEFKIVSNSLDGWILQQKILRRCLLMSFGGGCDTCDRNCRIVQLCVWETHGLIESPQVNTCLHHYSFIPARFLNQDAADGDDVPQDLARGMAIYSATRLQEYDGQQTVWSTHRAWGILRMRSPRPWTTTQKPTVSGPVGQHDLMSGLERTCHTPMACRSYSEYIFWTLNRFKNKMHNSG